MKFAVDEIIDDIVILENIRNGEIKEVNLNVLPLGTKETDILILENGMYKLDINEKDNRINILREKMNKLRNKN